MFNISFLFIKLIFFHYHNFHHYYHYYYDHHFIIILFTIIIIIIISSLYSCPSLSFFYHTLLFLVYVCVLHHVQVLERMCVCVCVCVSGVRMEPRRYTRTQITGQASDFPQSASLPKAACANLSENIDKHKQLVEDAAFSD